MTNTPSPAGSTGSPPADRTVKAFHVMTKPIGPLCNLDCKYCFYLEKENLFPSNESFKMSDEVLETYIRNYIAAQEVPEIHFAWQGGEPTLLGVNFFRKVIELQKKHAQGKLVFNAFQTNGTLLNDEWGQFLAENSFLVGVSVDGPPKLHNSYRVSKKGGGTYEEVVRGINFLRKHGVEFNTLTVVNRLNSQKPLEVYRTMKTLGSKYLQFIPIVERPPDSTAKTLGLDLAAPPDGETSTRIVTEWSVDAAQYGVFLTTIFDEWVRNDVGRIFVQLFDVTLANWMGEPPGLCLFSPTCGTAMAMEHNGDLYSCDHFVYPQYRLGNIMNTSLGDLVNSQQQKDFGRAKKDALPKYCLECDVRSLCHGECPKHRFIATPDGEPGLNYLCRAYKHFFHHSEAAMKTMCSLLRAGRAPAEIMTLARR